LGVSGGVGAHSLTNRVYFERIWYWTVGFRRSEQL